MRGVPDPIEFVRALRPSLRRAAAAARSMEGRVANQPKSGEARPAKAALTSADTATQETILVDLLAAFPNVALEAEEDTETVERFPAQAEARVVIDPIDGTLHSYLEGLGPYGIMVGLEVGGAYQAALVALPREGLYFDAVRGGGASVATEDSAPIRATPSQQGRGVIVSHGLPEEVAARLREGGFEPTPGCGGAVAVAPLLPGVCAGLRIAGPPGDVSIRGRIGALISAEAGARLRKEGGEPFPTRNDAAARALLVTAGEEELAALEAALDHMRW